MSLAPHQTGASCVVASGSVQRTISYAEAQNFYATGLRRASLVFRDRRSLCSGLLGSGLFGLFVPSRDDHCPIGAAACGAFDACDTNPRGTVQKEIPTMPARLNPLIERLGEAVIAIGDILGGPLGA